MFKSGQVNPYDDIVVKTTDENLTAENWELILTLCDKVADEGETGARNVIAAVLRRLTHRNPNVQLYALSLAEALSKNCGTELHRELSSRSFTQALEKIVTDRTTHDKVKRRTLTLIAMWTEDFKDNPSLGIMEECYNNLKAKNFKFDQPPEAPPPQGDEELRRKEEEELQRVLEMSVHDKGGRVWNDYSSGTGGSSSAAGGSGSGSTLTSTAIPRVEATSPITAPSGGPTHSEPSYTSPASPSSMQHADRVATPVQALAQAQTTHAPVTRVRALHTFTPTEPGELSFEKGDIIKVVDRNYKDWWRGQLRGRTGIFPVNYVEPLPELTREDITREAEMEAAVFQQASDLEKLLTMLRNFESDKESLADNEEIQELYRSSMSLRPKIVKLIDKYNQKKAELVLMNESFIKAKTIFERMMEESLARHTSEYGGVPIIQQPQQRPGQEGFAANQSRASIYGWNPSVYDQPGAAGYGQYGPTAPYTGPPQDYAYQPTPAGATSPYGPVPQGSQLAYPQPDPGYQTSQQPPGYPTAQIPVQTQSQQQQQTQLQPTPGPETSHIGQPHAQQQQQQPAYQQQPPQTQNPQHQPTTQMHTAQQQSQANGQAATHPDTSNGPPYDYDPKATYPDAGAQAWAQYYAQGGTDPAGAVYFKFVPGITEPTSAASQQPPVAEQQSVGQNGSAPQNTTDGSTTSGYVQAAYGASPYQTSTGVSGDPAGGLSVTAPQSTQSGVAPPQDYVPPVSQPTNVYPLQQQQYPTHGNHSQVHPDAAIQAHSPVQQMHHQFSALSVGPNEGIAPYAGSGNVTA